MEEIEKLEDLSVEKIERLDIAPNDIIVLTVDCGKLSPKKREEYLESVKHAAQKAIPDNTWWVIPNTMDVSVLRMVEEHV